MEGHTFISENPARQALTEGRKIAAIIATMGTTDSFGLDDLQAIPALRDALADSVDVDFHKTGFAPYISSLVLVKDRADLQRVARDPEQMPYLYQSGE